MKRSTRRPAITTPAPAETGYFKLGTIKNPAALAGIFADHAIHLVGNGTLDLHHRPLLRRMHAQAEAGEAEARRAVVRRSRQGELAVDHHRPPQPAGFEHIALVDRTKAAGAGPRQFERRARNPLPPMIPMFTCSILKLKFAIMSIILD